VRPPWGRRSTRAALLLSADVPFSAGGLPRVFVHLILENVIIGTPIRWTVSPRWSEQGHQAQMRVLSERMKRRAPTDELAPWVLGEVVDDTAAIPEPLLARPEGAMHDVRGVVDVRQPEGVAHLVRDHSRRLNDIVSIVVSQLHVNEPMAEISIAAALCVSDACATSIEWTDDDAHVRSCARRILGEHDDVEVLEQRTHALRDLCFTLRIAERWPTPCALPEGGCSAIRIAGLIGNVVELARIEVQHHHGRRLKGLVRRDREHERREDRLYWHDLAAIIRE
jgi:hypothetical protein